MTYCSETGYRGKEFTGDPGPAADPDNSAYTATQFLVYAKPVAVTLMRFDASTSDHKNLLRRVVADEQNIDYYKVLR